MTYNELQSLSDEVVRIVTKVASYIKDERLNFKSEYVEIKSLNDFVSYVDKSAEKRLILQLSELVPNAGYLTEENTIDYQQECEYYWIIDPLDGTTNFIHGSTPYAISVALFKYDEPLIGVIYEITRDEVFYAWKGSKAYMNGNVIKVSDVEKLSDALIATGRPHDYLKFKTQLIKTLEFFTLNTHGLRQSGSAATDLAYVACGRYEGRFEFGLKPWDIAAGIIIIQQAGGKVSDFSGNNEYFKNGEFVAANSLIHEEMQYKLSSLIYNK